MKLDLGNHYGSQEGLAAALLTGRPPSVTPGGVPTEFKTIVDIDDSDEDEKKKPKEAVTRTTRTWEAVLTHQSFGGRITRELSIRSIYTIYVSPVWCV